MTVYVDVTYVLCVTFQSGIPRVVREVLLRLMRKSNPPLTPIYYDVGGGEYRLVNPDKLLVALELGKRQLEGLITKPAFDMGRISKGDVFLDIDAVWHLSPDRGVLYPRLKASGASIISYVYDVIPVSDPQSCNADATRKFLSYLDAVLGNADLILAPTQSTLDEIDRLCDERSMPRIPSRFTWLGSDFTESLANKCHLRTVHPDAAGACRAGRYVLMVGTIQPIKNQRLVLDAFDQALFAKGVNLVIAGRIGWDVETLEKRIREHPLLGRRLFFLEGMDDATIDYLYRNAFCLAFATRREGFGLPTVEALQRGVPVLASDIPVLHEVGGDFCRYFNPDSSASFIEAIEPLLESPDEYNALRAKVATYRPVTWDLVSAKIAAIAGGMLSGRKSFYRRLLVVVVLVLSVFAICMVTCFKRPDRNAADVPRRVNAMTARQRPGVVYKPTSLPLRHSPRPDLAALASLSRRADNGAEDNGDNDDLEDDSVGGEDDGANPEDGDEDEGEEVLPPEPIPPDDPALASMGNERDFASLAWSIVESQPEIIRDVIASRFESKEPADRALAGVLAFLTDTLEGDVLDLVSTDSDPMVPLTVLDWVRDFGTDENILALREAIASRGLSQDYLLEVAKTSASTIGGGRSALDMWLAGFSGDTVPADALAAIVTSPGVSYDVRAQAFFKLLEPETRTEAMKALDTFAGELTDASGVLLPQTAEKWRELSSISNSDGDDEKIWDAESAVVFFLSQSDSALPARDLANYLEYALRRDDPEFPPIVEEGTWEFANECFDRLSAQRDALSNEELDALDRIAVSLDRLVEFDPAFNPFETVEDDGEEDDEAEDDEDLVDADDDDVAEEEDDDVDEEEDVEAAEEADGEEDEAEDDVDEEP